MKKMLAVIAGLALVACQPATETEEPAAAEPAAEAPAEIDALGAILDAQSDEAKARYQYRHPRETLDFFGIEPGMTVVEGLPGGGWYTGILLPYLGSEGTLPPREVAYDR